MALISFMRRRIITSLFLSPFAQPAVAAAADHEEELADQQQQQQPPIENVFQPQSSPPLTVPFPTLDLIRSDHQVSLTIGHVHDPDDDPNFPLPANNSDDDQPVIIININPVLKNWRDLELGKAMFVSGMTLGVFLVTFREKLGPVLRPAMLILLPTGIVCLFFGLLLRDQNPDKPGCLRLELFGGVCVLHVVFIVLGSFLPLGLACFPVVSSVVILMLFAWSFS